MSIGAVANSGADTAPKGVDNIIEAYKKGKDDGKKELLQTFAQVANAGQQPQQGGNNLGNSPGSDGGGNTLGLA